MGFRRGSVKEKDDDVYASVWLIDDGCKLSTDAKYMKCVRASALRLAGVYG